jgi:hypothetical protein
MKLERCLQISCLLGPLSPVWALPSREGATRSIVPTEGVVNEEPSNAGRSLKGRFLHITGGLYT